MKSLIIREDKFEQVLESLDCIKHANAPPFLYEKTQAKLNAPSNSFLKKIDCFIDRPAVIISIVSLILLMYAIIFESIFKHMSDNFENNAYGISIKDDLKK